MIFFSVCGQSIWAQRSKMGSVYVKVVTHKKDSKKEDLKIPVDSCTIYVFKSQRAATTFFNSLMAKRRSDNEGGSGLSSMDIEGDKSVEDIFVTGMDGSCNLSPVGMDWFLVAFREDDSLLSDHVVPIASRVDIEIDVKSGNIEIDTVVVSGHLTFGDIETQPHDCGDRRTISATYTIPSRDTNSTFRYGIAPFCNEVTGEDYGFTSAYQNLTPSSGRSYKKMRPYLMDGERYHKTQHRKMGFSPEDYDPMERYVKAQKVRTRDKDTIQIHIYEELNHIKPNTFYPVWSYKWYENYGSLVKGDTVLLDNGYRHDRTQFLDYSFPEVDIQRKFYQKNPRPDLDEGSAELHIEFVRGEAEILSSDSSGLAQLREITRTLEKIYQDNDARLYYVHIRGYASPEGGRSVNESLCRRRAGYLQHQLIAHLGGTSSDIEGVVASWLDVAKLLRRDSISDPENMIRAQQIEEIVASSTNEVLVDAKIQALPLARYLKEHEEKYYKPLRKVEISYEYKQQRILNREEVIERYERTGEVSFPYQYAYLFDYLKDRPKELGEVARKAMQERETTGKPWPLAAYYLAKSYTARNMCDTLILKPYISLNGREFYEEVPGSSIRRKYAKSLLNATHVNENGRMIQIVNDEGIVIQQILMFLKADMINDAYRLADNLLPEEDSRFALPKMMLKCRCDGWNEEEVRDMVASTSDWNRVVVYAAQDSHGKEINEDYWKGAWDLLNDTTVFKMNQARELYMKATLAFRLYKKAEELKIRTDKNPIPSNFFDLGRYSIYDHPSFDNEDFPWGAAMVKACEIEPSFIDLLKFDGEFSQNYRDGFAIYWNEHHPDHILK